MTKAKAAAVTVIYRGRSGHLVAGEHRLDRDGDPVAIPAALYEQLSADPTIQLDVVEPSPAAPAESTDAGNGDEEET